MDKNYYLVVKQCVAGRWITLIEIAIVGKLSPEQATERLSEFTDKLFESGKMFATKKTESVVFNCDKWPVSVQLNQGECEE